MAKIDRSILQANDQNMGDFGDPNKLEASISHLADKIDGNDDETQVLKTDNTSNKGRLTTLEGDVSTLKTDNTSNKSRISTNENNIAYNEGRLVELLRNEQKISEVVDARMGFPVLRDKLESVDTQLADNANDIKLALGTGYLGEKYPKLTGETDDTARYQRALNDLKASGGGKLVLPNKAITISSNVKADPTNGSIVVEGAGSSKIIVATDNLTYGFTIGQTCYNQKNVNLNHNVTLQNVEFEASGTPKGGVFVEPGAFMPRIRNVKFKDFQGDGACIYVYNDGYNNATLSKYSWVDNATFEDVVCENVKNGIWFVGNVDRSTETGQTSKEDTFSQTKLKNCYIQVSAVGGHAYHFEGSFARSVFDGDISFMEGNALNDVNTNRELATSYHYFLKGNFIGTSFISLAAEGGGWVIRLDPSMLPDTFGDNANLDNLGTWINTTWLNIPDSTRKLLKIIDPAYKGSKAYIDSSSGTTTRKYRRDNSMHEESGMVKIIGDTAVDSGYKTVTITFSEPFIEIFDSVVSISLEHLTTADKILYAGRIDNFGIDSMSTTNGKITSMKVYCKVNTNTSQGVQIRFTVKGRIESKWDYYYA